LTLGSRKIISHIAVAFDNIFLHDYLGSMTPPDIPPQLDEITISRIEPATIVAREPTNVTVHAVNSTNGTPVDGEVIIDAVGTVGRTNTPFNFTFNTNSSLVTGRVAAPGYTGVSLTFDLVLPALEVHAEPTTIEINREIEVESIFGFVPLAIICPEEAALPGAALPGIGGTHQCQSAEVGAPDIGMVRFTELESRPRSTTTYPSSNGNGLGFWW
jgi:hypothetical protein